MTWKRAGPGGRGRVQVVGEGNHCSADTIPPRGVHAAHRGRRPLRSGAGLHQLARRCCRIKSWGTSLINEYVQAGAHWYVMDLFFKMRAKGI
jgi:hypothetical protein